MLRGMRNLVLFPICLSRLIISPWHLRKIQPAFFLYQTTSSYRSLTLPHLPVPYFHIKMQIYCFCYSISVTEFICRVKQDCQQSMSVSITIIMISSVTQIHVWVDWAIIGLGNGLPPVRRQGITWNNSDFLSIEPLGTNHSVIVM